ncbi:beta-microseminoprotein-like isoform X2 [Silurus meridionalis]|uniref:beta-microseminoprotein-like isoform X2 n=1 Tax=Silurus meridionalis TaxID=175797 RepID=UPI001EEB65E0|nr:beta-microseminoprotein-like isoform X2 [Silurus meridionalis]
MRAVFVGLVLLSLVSVSYADCNAAEIEEGVTHCQDLVDGTWHMVGSMWTNSKCEQCSCSASYLACCDGLPTGVSKDCTIEFDYETCTFDLINNIIPGGSCSVDEK